MLPEASPFRSRRSAVVHRDAASVLECMRAAARQRGVVEEELPTEARPGAVYIEVRPVKRISWDYGKTAETGA